MASYERQTWVDLQTPLDAAHMNHIEEGIASIVGITSIKQTTTSTADGGNNVITATLDNGTTETFNIKNGSKGSTGSKGDTGAAGVGIKSVVQTTTSSADGGNNVITVTKTDGTTSTFSVKNGSKGSTGATGPQGPQGDKGDKGDKGDTGATGSPGAKGDTGADYVLTDADCAAIVAEIQSTANQQVPLFANNVSECTDTSKVYVLPDGYIYGYIMSEVAPPTITIEEHTNGYWISGPKFNTGQSGYSSKSTNVIPVTPGDQLQYYGMGASQAISVAWLDTSQVQLSTEQYNSNWNPTTVTVTAPQGAAYARFFSFKQTTTVSSVKLTVTWILCQAAGKRYDWANTGHAFVPADYEARIAALEENFGAATSVLKGKKIIYDGDSIAESRTGSASNNGGGYAKLIADSVGGVYVNQAVGGARLTTASNGAAYHSVVDNLPNLPKDGDLYCFEGGINDYWTPKALGSFSKTDFTGTLDANTICGALETIFRYALNNFVGKAICFVITHKIQSTAYVENTNGDTFEDYRNAMAGICQKYSIPYYDAFSESGLNGWNTAQNNAYLTSNSSGAADGIHPNEEGYKRYYVPQLISLFERIMPR